MRFFNNIHNYSGKIEFSQEKATWVLGLEPVANRLMRIFVAFFRFDNPKKLANEKPWASRKIEF